MLVIRSLLFNLLFYLNLVVQILAALPTLLMPRRAIVAVATFWARTNLWLLRAVCGINAEFRGLGKIPDGPLLVSSKHQSLWETFALLLILPDAAYIMKRELMWIPFFGWYAWKAGMIPIDRSRGSQALADMNKKGEQMQKSDPQSAEAMKQAAAQAQSFAAPLTLGTSSAALVYDTSNFGATSPVQGQRYRLEVAPTVGAINFTSALLDYRRYFMPAPFYTIAVRGIHYRR